MNPNCGEVDLYYHSKSTTAFQLLKAKPRALLEQVCQILPWLGGGPLVMSYPSEPVVHGMEHVRGIHTPLSSRNVLLTDSPWEGALPSFSNNKKAAHTLTQFSPFHWHY